MKKRALITGVFGQDGSYVAELLAKKGYEVHGIARLPLSKNAQRICAFLQKNGIDIITHECLLEKYTDVLALISALRPHECYHLAATHYSSQATEAERLTIARELYQNNIISASNLLHAIHVSSPETKVVFAGSSLMFDATNESPQDETTPFSTASIYGLSKVAAAELARFYRAQHGMHVTNAILYNHESPRRSFDFVTQKIAWNVAQIKMGTSTTMTLGNLHSAKDWGYAQDYANGMYLAAQQEKSDDYIFATGELHSVEEFLSYAFRAIGVEQWRDYVTIDATLATKLDTPLRGNAQKAYQQLNWKHTLTFSELAEKMVNAVLDEKSKL
ncbi:MAG: hypothetical protein A3I05_05090 [Deltaproteobacteria bacterium RIFCSPLOWO2_02_FULL_44_10]|nr:MAG: hypothetical protein A3C46_05845 [Deltaproteobacteria bacterium RIFCSPHIGHO2_02_FULL_44_16]OGQ45968.1 MAG: hypothetical protein A3I05_05090 [Deltaproteobacteria bacterium RIFCSPLOWO2_02_FULL_44_10]